MRTRSDGHPKHRYAGILLAVAIGLLALLVSVGAPVGAAPTMVNGCQPINSSGEYELSGDIDGSAEDPCIEITASNVTLDGAGHTITGDSSWNSKVVYVAVSDADASVVIENLTVAGDSYYGVYVSGSHNVTVDDVTSTSLNTFGVYVNGGSGNLVTNSTLTEDGVGLKDSDSNLVDGNTFEAATASIDGGSNNAITNNTFDESSTYPYDNCGGVNLDGSSGDLVAHNTITGCSRGMNVDDATDVTILNNTVENNRDGGVSVMGGSGNSLIDNIVHNNDLDTTAKAGVYLGGTTNAYLENNTLTNNQFNLRVQGTAKVYYNHTILPSNTMEGKPVYYYVDSPGVTVPTDAGWVALITSDNALVENVTPSKRNYAAIFLWGSDDVVARNVNATESFLGVTLQEGSDRTSIEGSTLDRMETALDINDATGTRVVDTTVTNADRHGATIDRSSNVTFENVTLAGGDMTAIYVFDTSSQEVIVRNSTISQNGNGIDLNRAHGSTLVGNDIRDNGGYGVRAQEFFNNGTFADNTITGNDNDGITFSSDERDNVIVDNNISDNGANGIELGFSGHNDAIYGNVITGNAAGIHVPSTHDNPTVYDNHFNNTQNVVVSDPSGLTNATWNVTATVGTNVVGGTTVGGNYWANQSGDGFSQTCTDADSDGFCDTSLTFDGQTDFLPLAMPEGEATGPDVDVSPTAHDYGNVSVGNASLTNVTVSNDGATGLNVTGTSISGPNASAFSITAGGATTLPPSASTNLTIQFAPATNGSKSATLSVTSNDSDEPSVDVSLSGTGVSVTGGGSGESAAVTVNSITVSNGTVPNATPYVEAWIDAQPMLQLNLRSSESGPYDLEPLGVDDTTEFEIDLTVENFTPRLLLGAGNMSGWERTANGTNATDVTVLVRPVSTQSIWECDGGGNCTTPDLNDWPEGANDTATNRTNVTVSLAIDELGVYPTAQRDALNGTVITTDAQLFGDPTYTPATAGQPATLSLLVGGPHFTVDGSVNEGFYDALLPKTLIDDWGIVDPESELSAAYDGQPADFDATETAAGDVRIEVDIHYSAGEVSVSAASDGGDGGSGSSTTGSSSSGSSDDGGSTTTETTPTPTPTSTPTSTPASTSTATTAGPTTADTETDSDDAPTTSGTTQSTQAPPTTSAPGQPGFGLVVTVLAVLGALLVAGRRR